jgi:hypothetical protein
LISDAVEIELSLSKKIQILDTKEASDFLDQDITMKKLDQQTKDFHALLGQTEA